MTRRISQRQVFWLAGLAFVAGLIVFLPAKLIESSVNTALAPKLRLSTSGTIWCGSGSLRSTQTNAIDVPITWRFAPLSLFRLRAAWQLAADGPALNGSSLIGAGVQTVELRDAKVDVDVGVFATLNAAAEMFRPSGRVQIDTESLTVRYDNVLRAEGDAHLNIDRFGLGSMAERPIGSYAIDIQGRDTKTGFTIGKSSGMLVLDGSGSVATAAPRQFVYNGNALLAGDAPEAIRNAINAIGKTGTDGRIRIEQKINW